MNPPKPFCFNPTKVKAFVLGCDPTAFDKNRKRKEFQYVFDIGNDKRYFAGVLANLKLLGLSMNEIYVQNLVTDYQEKETGKNIEWKRIAENYISRCKQEFNIIDPNCYIPVFLTSQHLYKVLVNSTQPIYSAKDLYDNKNVTPIKAYENKLERPLIPLFRHRDFNLSKKVEYKNRIQRIL